ncbi:hypothetical protein EVAR_56552_1 [Eumeta japonica]|uniref:Uncharacterized protein n=1 Tax=Eumeta variegata TaxID=151549 RepID=A0A4C1ZX66_EUMVA|nr:hypothetical protein EVAR_56552_1 [Eumeta japonica]
MNNVFQENLPINLVGVAAVSASALRLLTVRSPPKQNVTSIRLRLKGQYNAKEKAVVPLYRRKERRKPSVFVRTHLQSSAGDRPRDLPRPPLPPSGPRYEVTAVMELLEGLFEFPALDYFDDPDTCRISSFICRVDVLLREPCKLWNCRTMYVNVRRSSEAFKASAPAQRPVACRRGFQEEGIAPDAGASGSARPILKFSAAPTGGRGACAYLAGCPCRPTWLAEETRRVHVVGESENIFCNSYIVKNNE